jgi:hypothetical protein
LGFFYNINLSLRKKNTNYFNKTVFFFKNFFFKKRISKTLVKGFFNKYFILISFFFKFFLLFLEFYFKKKIFLKIKKKKKNKFFLKFFKIIKKIKLPFKSLTFRKYFKKNVVSILFYSLLLKDCIIFCNFLKNFLENIHLKQHKKFFIYLKKIFKKIKHFFTFLAVKGIYINVKGKISVTGNAKKRRFFFKFKKNSLTKKTLKIEQKFISVRTSTGVLGLFYYIFF